jgi:beta-lactam-binding protein with PASTA domain
MYALNLESQYRFQSAKEFADEIIKQMGIIKGPTPPEPPIGPTGGSDGIPKKIKIALSVAAVCAVIIVGVVLAVLTPNNSSIKYAYTIANLEGKSSDEVLAWARQEKVKVSFDGHPLKTSDENANGKVVWQEFKEGYKVRADEADDFVLRVKTAVYDINAEIYKSKMIKMPNLKNKTEQEVRDILEEKGFYNYKFTEKQFSDKIKEGRVCEQSVEKGKSVRADKEIYITFSKGSADKKSKKN